MNMVAKIITSVAFHFVVISVIFEAMPFLSLSLCLSSSRPLLLPLYSGNAHKHTFTYNIISLLFFSFPFFFSCSYPPVIYVDFSVCVCVCEKKLYVAKHSFFSYSHHFVIARRECEATLETTNDDDKLLTERRKKRNEKKKLKAHKEYGAEKRTTCEIEIEKLKVSERERERVSHSTRRRRKKVTQKQIE